MSSQREASVQSALARFPVGRGQDNKTSGASGRLRVPDSEFFSRTLKNAAAPPRHIKNVPGKRTKQKIGRAPVREKHGRNF